MLMVYHYKVPHLRGSGVGGGGGGGGGVGRGAYCFQGGSLGRHTFLSAQYLVNQWLDSYQTSWIYNWDILKN